MSCNCQITDKTKTLLLFPLDEEVVFDMERTLYEINGLVNILKQFAQCEKDTEFKIDDNKYSDILNHYLELFVQYNIQLGAVLEENLHEYKALTGSASIGIDDQRYALSIYTDDNTLIEKFKDYIFE